LEDEGLVSLIYKDSRIVTMIENVEEFHYQGNAMKSNSSCDRDIRSDRPTVLVKRHHKKSSGKTKVSVLHNEDKIVWICCACQVATVPWSTDMAYNRDSCQHREVCGINLRS